MNFMLTRAVLIFSVLAATGMQAQDDPNYLIFVPDDQASPMVTSDLVNSLGSRNLLSLLGEDYVVTGQQNMSDLASTNVIEPTVLPDIGIPGILPGILPVCQCPEGYVTALRQRIQSQDIVFDPAPLTNLGIGPERAVVITSEQISKLRDQGIDIEDLIQTIPSE